MRGRAGIFAKPLLASIVLALSIGASVTSAAVIHSEAKPIGDAPQTSVGVIDGRGDRDWYTLSGGAHGYVPRGDVQMVTVDQTRVPASCAATAPLHVSLYNPEGFWVARAQAPRAGRYVLVVPRLPGRYLVKISIEDPGCAGLGYRIQGPPHPTGSNGPVANVQFCNDDHKAERKDRKALRGNPSARQRRRVRRDLAMVIRNEAIDCARHA